MFHISTTFVDDVPPPIILSATNDEPKKSFCVPYRNTIMLGDQLISFLVSCN